MRDVMKSDKAKKIASVLLGVGKNKIWINPEELDSIKEAITKDDIRELIKKGVIKKVKESEQSMARARRIKKQKEKGRRRGHGKRKGKKDARMKRKKQWMGNVRAQRALLRKIRKENPEIIKKIGYRKLYKMIKGGFFKSKAHLEHYIKGGK